MTDEGEHASTQRPAMWGPFTVVAKGFAMGSADVVPGVSGGTMALILGIYQRLLNAIRSFDASWVAALVRADLATVLTRPHLGFLLPLLVGIGLALAFFTRVVPIPELLLTHPEPIYGLFFGLVLASVPVLAARGRAGVTGVVLFALGALSGFGVVNLVPVATPTAPWFLALAGFLAMGAMLLPGISGSFVLLILNQYATVFRAIGQLDLTVLIPFALGALGALIALSRLFGWMLARFEGVAMSFIAGILLGSLWVIWPFQDRVYADVGDKQRLIDSDPIWPTELTGDVVGALGFIVLGALAVVVLNRLAGTRHQAAHRGAPD